MSQQERIAVVGATGAQGGGLARAILSDPAARFAARALTRRPDSERAEALRALGAEVVPADLDDVDSLVAAFDGCHGLFAVTNFWEHFSPDREMAQAGNMARAAKAAGVRHVVWSTLDDTRRWVPLDDDRMPTLQGRYKVPHFDGKGEADRLFTDAGVPTTFLLTTYFWDNLLSPGMAPQRAEDGGLVLGLPMGDAKLPGIASEDIGKCALGIFRAGDAYVGESVGVAGEHLSGAEMAAALSETLGAPVRYVAIPFDTFRSFDFPGADDLGNMFQFYHDFTDDYRAGRDVGLARSLNPELLDFRGWLAKHGSAIPRS